MPSRHFAQQVGFRQRENALKDAAGCDVCYMKNRQGARLQLACSDELRMEPLIGTSGDLQAVFEQSTIDHTESVLVKSQMDLIEAFVFE